MNLRYSTPRIQVYSHSLTLDLSLEILMRLTNRLMVSGPTVKVLMKAVVII